MELFILGHFQAVRLLGEINSVYGAVFEYGHERIKAPLFKVNAAQLALWPAGGPSEKACLGQRRRSLDHRLLRLKEDFFFFLLPRKELFPALARDSVEKYDFESPLLASSLFIRVKSGQLHGALVRRSILEE